MACEDLIDESRPYSLCDRCIRDMEWIRGRTCRCGKALNPEWKWDLCSDCMEGGRVFDRGIACTVYNGRAKEVIRGMKYRDRPWHGRHIADIMADRLTAESDRDTGEMISYDYIIPVPMHGRKERRRGYNQAALIGKALADNLSMDFAEGVLIRKRPTSVMSGLGRSERVFNLEGAFAVKAGCEEMLNGASLLLVDDVYTTGSTADACARALFDAGASKVDVMVFAAGANYAAKHGA